MATDDNSNQSQDTPNKRCASCGIHKWRRQTGQNRTNGQNRSRRDLSRQMTFGEHIRRLVHQRTQELADFSSNEIQPIVQRSSHSNYLPLNTMLSIFANNLYVT